MKNRYEAVGQLPLNHKGRKLKELAQARIYWRLYVHLRSALENKGRFWIVGRLCSHLFHASLPIGTQKVKTKAID